jgi:acetylornithine deacetylase/succinyl-diaminopimelate desuccinylase-like protein
LAGAIDRIGKIKVSQGTTYSVGVIGGGASVNVIPGEAWMQVDMRSASNDDLKRLESAFLDAVKHAGEDENAARSTSNGVIETNVKLLGDRPSGNTPSDHRMVQIALAASASQGWKPMLDSGSTDSNIAMSLSIPAITLAEGVGNYNHSLREYLDVEPAQSLRVLQLPLISILDTAHWQGD